MGWNDHQDVERSEGLRRLLEDGALEADSRQEILARYILNHGFAALSETQQQEFQEQLLPLLDRRDRSEGLMPQGDLDPAIDDPELASSQINDPGNEDPGSLIEIEVAEGLHSANRSRRH
ncbi:hypothetical protein BWR15_24410 [Pseudomonas sp. T]|uniref:Uncharacterized protein n=1 Tax=Pseudomonas denitrificans TaxID=43306 RepID=A0A9X7MXQ0_PSEDE|nr:MULTISPECIES: hypothetical protein [Pseudomonadaceae]MBD9629403.1 hypothetical protein [Pseudomonas sp. PDM19]OQR29881.1 hypothetical protein BWR15_24410 [Pseudomonas sp. T]QEY71537.1 hypothetical protein F1C79_07795 [Pseudomonas denitrificans (nom. rej.)]